MERHKYGRDRSQGKKAVSDRGLVCATCGRTGHMSVACYHRWHTTRTTRIPRGKKSVPGRAWAARGFTTLPVDRTLRGGPVAPGRGENHGELIPLFISCNILRASI
jgi:hypothetical protein